MGEEKTNVRLALLLTSCSYRLWSKSLLWQVSPLDDTLRQLLSSRASLVPIYLNGERPKLKS